MYLSPRKQLFVDTASDKFGGGSILNKSQVKETCDDLNIPLAGWFLGQCKVGYNRYGIFQSIILSPKLTIKAFID